MWGNGCENSWSALRHVPTCENCVGEKGQTLAKNALLCRSDRYDVMSNLITVVRPIYFFVDISQVGSIYSCYSWVNGPGQMILYRLLTDLSG